MDDEDDKTILDQSAEPSSMIGELARISVRRKNYQNKVLEESVVSQGRKQIEQVELLQVDDPMFGSRQLPKSRSIKTYPSQNVNLGQSDGEKYRTNNYISARNKNEPIVKNRESLERADFLGDVDEQELKNELLDRIQNFHKSMKKEQVEKRKEDEDLYQSKNKSKEPLQQNIITVGESRSYSFSTNTQPSTVSRQTSGKYLDGNHISVYQSPSQVYETKPTQENPDSRELLFTTLNPLPEQHQEQTDVSTYRTTLQFGEENTKKPPAEAEEEKVISVRVSSSVVSSFPNRFHQHLRYKTEKGFDSTIPNTEQNTLPFTTSSTLTLLTEEQPQVTAVQRSSFSVEEPAEDNYDPQISPVSYHSSVSSATSGSSVRFYSDPPSYHRRIIPRPVEDEKRSMAENLSQQPSVELEPTTKKVIAELTTGNFPADPLQYKHETRVETVSYHEEIVPSSQSDINFGKRVTGGAENKPPIITSTYVSTPTSTITNTGQDADRRSYQFTNVHDQSYHHVHVTHHRQPEQNRKEPEIRQRTKQDGRYFRYEGTSEKNYGVPERVYGKPEQNYEVDESVSLMTDGRAHGVQTHQTTTEATTDSKRKDNNKFGYVVEGRNFRKYRVEERTPDGFIVGEYGVVSNDDGSLRGVRYTADGTINPRLIYDALLKFLSL